MNVNIESIELGRINNFFNKEIAKLEAKRVAIKKALAPTLNVFSKIDRTNDVNVTDIELGEPRYYNNTTVICVARLKYAIDGEYYANDRLKTKANTKNADDVFECLQNIFESVDKNTSLNILGDTDTLRDDDACYRQIDVNITINL